MYFDFEEDRPDTPTIASPLSLREGVLVSVVIHLLCVIALLVVPDLPFMKALEQQRVEAAEKERLRQLEEARQNARFVFVQPRVDLRAQKPPERAELSDIDRRAQTVERAPDPTNALPFSRGNSAEKVEATSPAPPSPQPPAPAPEPPAPQPGGDPGRQGLTLPESPAAVEPRASENGRQSPVSGPSAGVIADAIRNVQKYVENEGFQNLRGGNQQQEASIQFDTKGVEFGPWIRRFVAQIRRNWDVPQAAMMLRGHVVITFWVHKDGRLTDLQIIKPAAVDGFNSSAFGALASSNPTYPLPPEYPDDKAFFTVTFYFNETPKAP